MAILMCKKNRSIVPATTPANNGPPIEIGRPIAVSLASFFPGKIKKDWGGKAEIMISSHVRYGPSNRPAPRRVNMLLQRYDFESAEPITNYGGDVYGDRMLYYSKAYAGQRLGITLRGVETDKINPRTWKGMKNAISTIGSLALFTPAAPYLAFLGVAQNLVEILVRAINRNERLQTSRADLYFDEDNQKILQTGRYLIWEPKQGAGSPTIKRDYRLSSASAGADEPNILVSRDGIPFKLTPYFVLCIDRKARSAYTDFEIGSGSAELLESFGDKPLAETVFHSVRQIAKQVNDAKQLNSIEDSIRDLRNAETDDERLEIKKRIKAHSRLFTKNNAELLNELLSGYLQ